MIQIPLKIYKANVNKLSNEEYALLRKDTFGASDIAVLFGLGFETLDELLIKKASPILTEAELAIGKLPAVHKGSDLEPLILQKFTERTKIEVIKPRHMYEIFPGLTVNFDGVTENLIPVEAKYISAYGGKYWTFGAPNSVISKARLDFSDKPILDIAKHITDMAAYYGVPKYYYTQVQTQMLGLGAKFGYITALNDKDWELYTYKIWRDPVLLRVIPTYITQTMLRLNALKHPEEQPNEENIHLPAQTFDY